MSDQYQLITFSFDSSFSLFTFYTTLTSLLIVVSLSLFARGSKQGKGDVQRPSTYAYGSIRQYPVASFYQKLEEFTYLVYLRIYMFIRDGWKSPQHSLAGENMAHSFRMTNLEEIRIEG